MGKTPFFRPRRLVTKYMFGIAIILIFVNGVASMFFYQELKNLYIQDAYQKARIVLGHVEATVQYVKEELRPEMYHVLGKKNFVLPAMSTSFVAKGIMDRFIRMFPDYVYRRVALDPMNPKDRADTFEKAMINRFALQRDKVRTWKGLIEMKGHRYFAYFKAVRMERSCLLCHGRLSISPKALIVRYGAAGGHNWKVGSIVGVESIAIPVDVTFGRLRAVALSVFMIGLGGMLFLFLVLNSFYYAVSLRPLKKASSFFKSVASGEKGLEARFGTTEDVEIAELAESFNSMIEHLQKSQDELNASELKYRHIFEASKDAIMITDCAGTVIDINNAGLELLGRESRQEVIKGMSLHDFMMDETADQFLMHMEKEGFIKDVETVFRKSGGEASVLLAASARKKLDKRTDYEWIIKDITERKKMEEQIRQADKLASIGQFAAGIAHEINNPLSAVLGYARLMMKDSAGPAHEDLSMIERNADACKKIVQDLLEFSRQTKTSYKKADLNATIEATIDMVKMGFCKNAEFVRDYADGLPAVTMDTGKIKQVWMNILMNACQAMGRGGSVRISTWLEPGTRRVGADFSDTGCGIPRNIQGRIFEPFFTTKEPGLGTGLGLAVSYGIIREHGGEIAFESEEGKGATFKVRLPVDGGRERTNPDN